jgi:hypothetical protein
VKTVLLIVVHEVYEQTINSNLLVENRHIIEMISLPLFILFGFLNCHGMAYTNGPSGEVSAMQSSPEMDALYYDAPSDFSNDPLVEELQSSVADDDDVFYDAPSDFDNELSAENIQLSAPPQANPDDNFLFGLLGDLEREKILAKMNYRSRARLASTSNEASRFVRQRLAAENELVAEALIGVDNAADYDFNYSNPALGINRRLNSQMITAMHLAARYGKVDLLRRLVSLGGNVNIRDLLLRTPVMHAAEHSDPKTLFALN